MTAGSNSQAHVSENGEHGTTGPHISVVVVVYNMPREAPRTLHSLSAAYQKHINADEFEIIVVDNGSTPPLEASVLAGLEGNFRLIRLDPAPPSPARAINVGLAAARADIIGVMIDGARLVTPGFLHFGRAGARIYRRPVVISLAWHLGFDMQQWSIQGGYNQTREDALLASIRWPQDGYRLFEIAALEESSIEGWPGTISESNGLFLTREMWDALDNVDERFDAAGGGLINHDILFRALNLPDSELVVLLGEATFHQLHGGIATNANYLTFPQTIAPWFAQYEAIRGRAFAPHQRAKRTYLGTLPPPALAHFARTIVEPVVASPVSPSFDRTLWTHAPAPRPDGPRIAALVDLAEAEFRARRFEAAASVARIARSLAPDEPAPQRLLASTGAWGRGTGEPPRDRRAGFHLARARAFRTLGDQDKAEAELRQALVYEVDLVEAYVALSELRLPGEGYQSWLRRFHELLKPQFYLEIGVAEGHTLALAQPPTRVIGVDPDPKISLAGQMRAETHIFCETSDDFFSTGHLTSLSGQKPLSLAFIDGAHVFAQSLRDFMNVERFCGERSLVLFHDTLPFDEITQRPDRQRKFYTGDVWKTILCLKHYRADLEIFTIATPWSGLTVVAGLDAASRVLHHRYEEAVAQFDALMYSDFENSFDEALNVVANDWGVVEARLRAHGVP